MKAIGAWAAGGLLVALLAGAGAWYLFSLRADLHSAEEERDDALQAQFDRDAVIKQLQETARKNELARKALATTQSAIRSSLGDREILIRNLQNENAELRDWAAVSLPAAVVGLRDHETITGAADYRKHLSSSSALQPAGSQAEK